MREFTLRNKTTRPIMSLSASLLKQMVAARPESSTLVLAKKCRDYKTLTGRPLSLDYDQSNILLRRAGANSQGIWTSCYSSLPHPLSHVVRVFQDGFMTRTPSESMSEDLAMAEAFFALLDGPLAAVQPA